MNELTGNIGCGIDSFGDVRADLNLIFPYAGRRVRSTANVRATAYALPIRSRVFTYVRCWHTLEHLDEPGRAIEELMRVGEVIDLKFPNAKFGSIYMMLAELIRFYPVILSVIYRRWHPVEILIHVRVIRDWPRRLRDHKFAIKIKGMHSTRVGGFPSEFHVVLDCQGKVVEHVREPDEPLSLVLRSYFAATLRVLVLLARQFDRC